MRRFFEVLSPCRDRAGDPDGGGGTAIDPGAPYEVGITAEPAAKPAEKSDVEKRLEALETESRRKDDRIRELEGESRYWAEKARGPVEPVNTDEEEIEDDPVSAIHQDDDSPEKLLDELNSQGREALRKRGFVTREDMLAELKRMRSEIDERDSEARDGAAFDQALARDFPDLVKDNERVTGWLKNGKRGDAPVTSDLYQRTGQHFRQMVEDAGVAPESKAARGLLRAAARAAQKDLEMDRSERQARQADRRARIDNQRGERDRSGGEMDDTQDDLSPQTRQIMGHLGRHLGDDPEAAVRRFAKGEPPARRNGRR